MRNKNIYLLMTIAVILFAFTRAQAEIVIGENHKKDTIDCANGDAKIAGNENELHFIGQCHQLTVVGGGNTVSVDNIGSLTVLGNSNTVTWGKALKGDRPPITNLGSGNTIRSGETSTAPKEKPGDSTVKVESSTENNNSTVQVQNGDKKVEVKTSGSDSNKVQVNNDGQKVEVNSSNGNVSVTTNKSGSSVSTPSGQIITITDDEQKRTIDCGKGGHVSISGDENEITFTGACANIEISGDENRIHINAVGVIAVSGEENHVWWKAGLDGKRPVVSDSGSENSVSQE